jgi:hypothetical protein
MAGATGLEPAASGVTGRRSNQLSYAPEGREAGIKTGLPLVNPYMTVAVRSARNEFQK